MAAHITYDVPAGITPQQHAASRESHLPYTIAFWGLLLAFEVFVFSLPLFPTGDGGLHLFYASVFGDLVRHRAPLYAHFYAIRHLVQPYLLHYYALILLSSVFSPDLAEKVLIAGLLLALATGFRSLVRALSITAPGLTLLIFPFLFSWVLAMGALNYLFALSLMFFALSEYSSWKALTLARGPRLLKFTALVLLLLLTHPVPLLLLCCFIAADIVLLLWNRRGTARSHALPLQYLALFVSCLAFLVPILIADRAQVGASAHDLRFHASYLREVLSSQRLCMFFLPTLLGRGYNKLYLLLFPLSLVLIAAGGLPQRFRSHRLTGSDRLALISLALFAGILLTPSTINGSSYFAARLWLPCWLLALAACAEAIHGSRWNGAAATLAVLLSAVTLFAAGRYLPPVALRSVQLEQAPLPASETGLLVQSPAGDQVAALHVNYPLYYWSAGRAFMAHGDVLLNSAWLNLTVLPLKEKGNSGLLRDYTPLEATENPNTLASYLATHPRERKEALKRADFILFVDPGEEHPDPALLAKSMGVSPLTDWTCETHGFYQICRKV